MKYCFLLRKVGSYGYGGKYGVQKDRVDKVCASGCLIVTYCTFFAAFSFYSIAARCLRALSRFIFSQPYCPIIVQECDHTRVPRLDLRPFCIVIRQLLCENIDLIRSLIYLAAMLSYVWLDVRYLSFVVSCNVILW